MGVSSTVLESAPKVLIEDITDTVVSSISETVTEALIETGSEIARNTISDSSLIKGILNTGLEIVVHAGSAFINNSNIF
jgi:hypothetical protein